MFTFLLGFTTKTVSDALRVFRDKITWEIVAFMQITNFIADRIKIIIMYYFVFLLRDLQIKIGSESLEDFRFNKRVMKRFAGATFFIVSFLQLITLCL
jgi:hypothetical protein